MASINKVLAEIRKVKPRSAWANGVKTYAIELLYKAKEWKGGAFELDTSNYKKVILSGAQDWKQYSEGAATLIDDEDIAKRLCTKSELVKTRNGELRPNARESWLDVQARALYQADMMIRDAIVAVNAPDRKTMSTKGVL